LADVAIRYADPDGAVSFKSLTDKISPHATVVTNVAGFLLSLGAATSYLQVAGSMLSCLACNLALSGGVVTSVSPSMSFWTTIAAQICMIVLVSPLTFCKSISKTTVMNFVGIGSILYVSVIAVLYADPENPEGSVRMWPESYGGLLAKMPVFMFAFACQPNLLPVVEETSLPLRRLPSFDLISGAAIVSGLLVYAPTMLLPYMSFGSEIKPNFMENYDLSEGPIKVAYFAAALAVGTSFPLQIHPMRRALLGLLPPAQGETTEGLRRIGVTGICVMVALAMAIGTNLELVMQITGLVGGNTACFVMPIWLFVKSSGTSSAKVHAAWVLLAVMLMAYPACLYAIFFCKPEVEDVTDSIPKLIRITS